MRRVLWLLAPVLFVAGCVSPNAYPSGTWSLDPKSVPNQLPLDPSLLSMTLTYGGGVTLDGVTHVKGSYTFQDPALTIIVPSEGIPKLFPAGSTDGITTIHATLNVDGKSLSVIINGNSFLFQREE